jgi:hypothetical protein
MAEGFSCSLDVLFVGLGISKLQFFIDKKCKIFFSVVNFFQFLVIPESGSGLVFSL